MSNLKRSRMEAFITKTEYSNVYRCMRQQFSRSKYMKKWKSQFISTTRGPRGGVQYDCHLCMKPHKPADMEVHHEPPVVPIDKTHHDMTLQEYWDNLWCDGHEIVYICKSCHAEITEEQRINR